MTIYSPITTGSGAFIVHEQLSRHIENYRIQKISPRLSLFPFLCRISAQNADITHTLPDLGPWVLPAHTRNIITFHNYYLDSEWKRHCSGAQSLYYSSLLKYYVNQSVKKAHQITAVSYNTADLIKKDIPSIKNVTVIRNGVDCKLFSPANRDSSNNTIKLLFAGNPTKRKGISSLTRIAAELPENITLRCTEGLRKHADSHSHPNIEWIERRPHEKMSEIYNASDILFFPSYREGLSLVLLEAMACGLPVVTTNISSMPELIEHGKGGFLYEPNDIKQAMSYINQLAKNKTLRLEMGTYNRQRIEAEFTLTRMIRDYNDLFNNA